MWRVLFLSLTLGSQLCGQGDAYPWPASHWPMDDVEDRQLEDIVGGRYAVLPVLKEQRDVVSGVMLPTFDPKVMAGLDADALQWERNEQGYATIQQAETLSFEGGFTISVWVKPDRRGGTMVILSSMPDGPSASGGLLLRYAYGTGSFHAFDDTGERVVVSTKRESVRPNRWSHFAVVGNETTIKFYHNGALVDEKPFAAPLRLANGIPMVIGNHATIASYRHRDCPAFGGLMQDLKIWEIPLSEEELWAASDESLHP